MKLRDILSRSNPLDLPMTAGTFAPSGMDEAGNRTFKDILGRTYAVQPKPAMTMDEFWARSENMRAPKRQAPPNVGKAIVDMLTSGFTAPGRALAGESVTLGDVLDTAGTATLGAAPMRKPAGALGANSFRAYHGSPHSFDKFSMDKIGTGEGAQAYGHGLYFAESEDVARKYRDSLGSVKEVEVIERPEGFEAFARRRSENDMLSRGVYPTRYLAEQAGLKNQGSMYEVQINADPETFLDWDKPLSEQPQAVRDMVEARAREALGSDDAQIRNAAKDATLALRSGNVTGEGAIRTLERLMSNKAKASAALREQGVPGVKYLDAGSRGAGDGSRNYVVFDDALIEILRKYGLAGLMVGGAAATLPPPATDNAKTLRDYLGAI